MDITTVAHLESLLSSLQTGLVNMRAGSTMERGYMLEKLGAMRRILQPESGRADKLRALIWRHEYAVRDYAYARGLQAGLNGTGRFEVDPERAIIDYAENADKTESDLYDFIETMEN